MSGTQLAIHLIEEGAAVFLQCKFRSHYLMDYREDNNFPEVEEIQVPHTMRELDEIEKSPEKLERMRRLADWGNTQRLKFKKETNAGPAIVVLRGKCLLVNCEITDCL